MGKLFAWEGKFFHAMNKAADLILLNLFWFISSLPVITIGAATVALYSVTLKMAEDSEGYIKKEYWRAFLDHLKTATVSWLTLLTVQSVIIVVYFACNKEASLGGMVIKVCLWIMEILLLLFFSYIFPIQAYGATENQLSLWKQIFIICVANLPWSFALVMGEGILFWAAWRYTVQSLPVWMFAGGAVAAYVTSFVYLHVFRRSGGLIAQSRKGLR